MNKRWEFTDETKTISGATLRQIRAVKAAKESEVTK